MLAPAYVVCSVQ